jgi:hypothetical protein
LPIGGGQILHRPVMEGISAWLLRNRCAALLMVIEERVGETGTVNEGHRAEMLGWGPSSVGAPLRYWRMHEGGSRVVGHSPLAAREELVGPSTTLLCADERGLGLLPVTDAALGQPKFAGPTEGLCTGGVVVCSPSTFHRYAKSFHGAWYERVYAL